MMESTAAPVKCIKILVHTEAVRVAEFEMAPDTSGEVHYHTLASEHCICLQGQLEVQANGLSAHSLQPGDKLEIPAGVRHRIRNPGLGLCRYLVIQYGGAYDFIAT